MAGHVLRDSRGRFKGSTRGFGRGRSGQGGGYGNGRKARVKGDFARRVSRYGVASAVRRSVSPAQARTAIRSGAKVGVVLGASLGGSALLRSGARSGNGTMIAGGAVAMVAGRVALASLGAGAIRSNHRIIR